MNPTKLRTLVVDDEPFAREKVRLFLADYPDFEVVGDCEDGEQAACAILSQQPDVVFLDVEIPGKSGLEVLNSLPADSQPFIVVVTAFDRYAVQAFEVEALDYLLKPFNKTRFAQSIKRVRQKAASVKVGNAEPATPVLLSHSEISDRERMVIKSGSRIIIVRSSSVEWIEAQGDYVMVHAQKAQHLVRETMNMMEKRLDPRRFARIHRSAIVNLDSVRELRPLWGGDYRVFLQDGTQLTLSRNYRSAVRDKLAPAMTWDDDWGCAWKPARS
jgi:two-component system LytT family response regulator